jgi:hypothetical protein
MGDAMQETPLEPRGTDLWVATRPLPMWIGDIGCRMTVIRLSNGSLWLHSPVALDAATRSAVDALGPVRWIVGPSRVHHFYLGDWAQAYPDAVLCGAPGLPAKRRDLRFGFELDPDSQPPWGADVAMRLLGGAPSMSELTFFHPASRTLVLTDLVFNVPKHGGRARLFHRLVGATGRFGPHRIIRLAIRDDRAAGASLQAIRGWDFDRVVMSHGDVLERGGKAAFETAFARWLPLGGA